MLYLGLPTVWEQRERPAVVPVAPCCLAPVPYDSWHSTIVTRDKTLYHLPIRRVDVVADTVTLVRQFSPLKSDTPKGVKSGLYGLSRKTMFKSFPLCIL